MLPLSSCANSPVGEAFQRSLAADPSLENNPSLFGPATQNSPEAEPQTAELPANFPGEIPRYPDAQLQAVNATSTGAAGESVETQWVTADSAEQVQQFYQNALQSDDWQLSEPGNEEGAIAAIRDNLNVTVAIGSPTTGNSQGNSQTEFTLTYRFNNTTATDAPSPTPLASNPSRPSDSSSNSVPQPGDPEFIGPVMPSNWTGNTESATASSPEAPASQRFTDGSQAPEEFRQYIEDLAALGVFNSGSNNGTATATEFKPNEPITRGEYARWLVAANNLMYRDRPSDRIRLGSQSSQPAFQDVSRSDPSFPAIQGLAEAGLIPSPLSGDSTTVTFRPNAPLTREDLILWKTPIDTRQTLPNASLDAVKETWGFQDAARIDPKAMRAILADFQNGDQSNVRRAFGYTTLFQPKKTVTRAEAAAVLWQFGSQGEGISARDILQTATGNGE